MDKYIRYLEIFLLD